MNQKRFSLLELLITSTLFSILLIATIQTLFIAQRSEQMQIRKNILSVEGKKAKNIITKDLRASSFKSVDVLQKNIEQGGSGNIIESWLIKEVNFTEEDATGVAMNSQFKHCTRNPCSWYLKRGGTTPETSDDIPKFPHTFGGVQYYCTGSNLGSMYLSDEKVKRVWPGPNKKCPVDGFPLEQNSVPIKAVKMMTAQDRVGRPRFFENGQNFGAKDWQGFIFYVNIPGEKGRSGKLVKYTIYKDDLDLEPNTGDTGTDTAWKVYEGAVSSPATKPVPTPGESASPGIAPGEEIPPDVGIPTLMDLFDFNGNGIIETQPNEFLSPTFEGATKQEGDFEQFMVVFEPSLGPKLIWAKSSTVKNFSIEINLKTNQVVWTHEIYDSSQVTWSRTRTYKVVPTVVANHVVQWNIMTRRASQPYWDPAFPFAPINTHGVNIDKFATLTIVFNRPYRDAGHYLHDEYVLHTGIALY